MFHVGKEKFPNLAESIRNNTRKTRANFVPAIILAEHRTSAYDICNAQDVFVRTGATSAERMDQEEHYARDLKIWESESREGIWK